MAEKKNFAEIQRQDRNSLVKNIGIIIAVILILIVALFVWHYLSPEKKDSGTGPAQESAQLTMVPTTINYYDPQSEKTYDVGTSYIILSDGDNGYMKVDSDGTVSKVSSDGTFIGTVSDNERQRLLEAALNITKKDNQANMALSGLQTALEKPAIAEPETVEIPSEVVPMTTLEMLYKTAEGMGYTKEQFIRASYLAGGTPDDFARLVEKGADAEDMIKAVMSSAQTTTEEKPAGLTIEMQRIGIDETPTAVNTDENKTEYPAWMQMQDPTAGMTAVLETLSNAVSSGNTSESTWDSVNQQKNKAEWQNSQQSTEITASKLTRYDLVAGTTVPITIVTGVNTDLPGSIVGIVRQDVYDTLTGTNVLIPKGSRLLATYNSSVSFGQKSVQIAWTQLITPDGYQFSLPGFAGITPDGYSGVKGKYDGHFWQMLGGAMLGTLLDWGSTYATDQMGNMVGGGVLGELISALGGSAINTSSSVGQQYATMWANLQPTIRIKTGTETQLLVNTTITLKRN